MPTFHCVKCCDCGTFQSVQSRKDKKFNCKICGKKQSVIKVFARSDSAAQVRKVVQRLNLARGSATEEYEHSHAERHEDTNETQVETSVPVVEPAQSRWRHLEKAVNAAEGRSLEEEEADDDEQFVMAVPDLDSIQRGRKRSRKKIQARIDDYQTSDPVPPPVKRGRQQTTTAQRDEFVANHSREARMGNTKWTNRAALPPSRTKPSTSADDDGFLMNMGGDVAFEEEYM